MINQVPGTYNPIEIHDRAETMCHSQDSHTLQLVPQDFLDSSIGLMICISYLANVNLLWWESHLSRMLLEGR